MLADQARNMRTFVLGKVGEGRREHGTVRKKRRLQNALLMLLVVASGISGLMVDFGATADANQATPIAGTCGVRDHHRFFIGPLMVAT
jgi:hypothetical protein